MGFKNLANCVSFMVCVYILFMVFFFVVYSVYELLVVQYNRFLNSGLLNSHFACSFSQVLFLLSLFGLRHVPVCSYITLEIIVALHVNWEILLDLHNRSCKQPKTISFLFVGICLLHKTQPCRLVFIFPDETPVSSYSLELEQEFGKHVFFSTVVCLY